MKVFENQPFEFYPSIRVCGVLMRHGEQFLLLRRHPSKSYGNYWNLPAGKQEKGESTFVAALREVKEESGIDLTGKEVPFLGTLYIRCKEIHFEFHLFYSDLAEMPEVKLAEDEAIEGKWWYWDEEIYPLIPGGKDVLEFCKKKILQRQISNIEDPLTDLAF
jgi:8-oxo-dGTP diphosphatase